MNTTNTTELEERIKKHFAPDNTNSGGRHYSAQQIAEHLQPNPSKMFVAQVTMALLQLKWTQQRELFGKEYTYPLMLITQK